MRWPPRCCSRATAAVGVAYRAGRGLYPARAPTARASAVCRIRCGRAARVILAGGALNTPAAPDALPA